MKNSFPITASASLSRRTFLAISGALPAALAAKISVSDAAAESPAAESGGVKRFPVGLELYSVRDELARDLPNTLKTVASVGYQVVEFYSPYFKWTPSYA